MIKEVFENKYANLLGDDNFDLLAQMLRQPNIFEILKIASYEIRHSNFLAWLLDPHGTHGFGSFFLIRFLKDCFLKSQLRIASVAEVTNLATGKVSVYREWNKIDILLEFSDLVLVIENKIWTGEHDEQLTRYKETVELNFPNYRHFFVFLTPFGQDASMPSTYINNSYENIISNLEMMLRVNKNSINMHSRLYVNDYVNSLKMNIMGNSEANNLAKKIYYSHKDLFDFVIANRPNPVTEIQHALKKRIAAMNCISGSPGNGFVRFLSKNLAGLIPKDGGHRGWSGKESFLFEIALNFSTNKLRIYCTLPPDPCPSKLLLKEGLDKAFGVQAEHAGWILYYDDQITYYPLEIASRGEEAIESFIDTICPSIEKMITMAERELIPLLDNRIEEKNG